MLQMLEIEYAALTPVQPSHPLVSRKAQWTLEPVQRSDFAEVKELFLKLHLFNASLDPRFALSEEWEKYFDAYLDAALEGTKSRCLLACHPETGRPAGFILAAIHQDLAMWKYRDWVEVEALYLEPEWRGTGLAEALLKPVYHWANAVGLSTVQLYVTASNQGAIRFYEREGFRQTQNIMRKVIG